MAPRHDAALEIFRAASAYMARANFRAEVEWQKGVSIDGFTETQFLRETAWVILCSGFRERTVRRVFDYISLCFCDWESASAIVEAEPNCRTTAMALFRNSAKLRAIVRSAEHVEQLGFDSFKQAVLADPFNELQKIPYIGPVTVWHLAKNLGCDVAKPDRHLERLSLSLGFEDTKHLCTEISRASGEQLKVVDLVVWRYLADNPHVLKIDSAASASFREQPRLS